MKRGGPSHPKTLRVALQAKIPMYAAVGLLELLFHFTAQYAPTGAIGKFSDEEIERALGWDGAPGVLVDALLTAQYLKTHNTYRMIVHDWHAHADQGVRNKLLKNKQEFVSRPTKVRPRVRPGSDLAMDPGPIGYTFPLAEHRVNNQEETREEGAATTNDLPAEHAKKSKKQSVEEEVIAYVNEVGGTQYQMVESNLQFVRGRLKEYDLFTLAAVVRQQWAKWKDDPKMREYFRPETLFGATKCAQYVGQLSAADRAWVARKKAAQA